MSSAFGSLTTAEKQAIIRISRSNGLRMPDFLRLVSEAVKIYNQQLQESPSCPL